MLSRAQLNFFLAAAWWPLPAALALSLFALWIGEHLSVWGHLLGFGIPGFLGFALWMSRGAQRRTEQQALRMVWLAPLKFIPFYFVPWVIYGVCCVIAGQTQEGYMAFSLIVLTPYFLIGGYVCAGVTVALYRIFF